MAPPELGEGELCRGRKGEGVLERGPGSLQESTDASNHGIGVLF